MNRIYSLASSFLTAMAVVLLASSVFLVPEGRALADDGGPGPAPIVCNGDMCDTGSCANFGTLNGRCENGFNFCNQNTMGMIADCKDCRCIRDGGPDQCKCRM